MNQTDGETVCLYFSKKGNCYRYSRVKPRNFLVRIISDFYYSKSVKPKSREKNMEIRKAL